MISARRSLGTLDVRICDGFGVFPLAGCDGEALEGADRVAKLDAGAVDAGAVAAGAADAGAVDAGAVDAGAVAAGAVAAGEVEAGAVDAGAVGAGAVEAEAVEAEAVEARAVEARAVEAGTVDAGTVGAGTVGAVDLIGSVSNFSTQSSAVTARVSITCIRRSGNRTKPYRRRSRSPAADWAKSTSPGQPPAKRRRS